jgi:hypothetical protein
MRNEKKKEGKRVKINFIQKFSMVSQLTACAMVLSIIIFIL